MTTLMIPPNPPTDLRERIAQLVMVRIGSNLPPIRLAHEDGERIRRLLDVCPVGGLLLFNGSWPDTRDALASLQRASAVPLLVASDIERGTGQQMAGLTLFPHQRAFLDLDDAEVALERFLEITAREARASGIHAIFGPVADVNTDPRNPIIATRAFGSDPEHASRLVQAYVRAAERNGLLSTAKHFPGHGDTHQDSHDAMPCVDVSGDTLRARELVPFRAAIEAGTSMIMSAHVEYPALDPERTPATLSRRILIDLLRGELGFEGVVCSDSLLMAGVRERFADETEMAIATMTAGVDLLLDLADPVAVVEGMARAVEDGTLPVARIDEALARVWRMKRGAFAFEGKLERTTADRERSAREALHIASGATRITRRDATFGWPLASGVPLTSVLLKPHHRLTDPAEQPLAQALRERFDGVTYFETGPEVPTDLLERVLAVTPEGSPLLIAMIVKPAAWHAFGLSEPQNALVRTLIDRRPVVLACLGVDSALEAFPRAKVHVCTHSDVPCSQVALAEALAGNR
ncbi:MAG: hypothetical protein H6834_18045 [Planctomycetes bacterium]|nr:hypothetical protein [Planctomycetota bacterium]